MEYTIAWFSGTGNTLRVARALASELMGAGLKVRLEDMARPTAASAGPMIICFPVYGYGPPAIVKKYIDNLSPGDSDVWLLCTMGGSAGSALRVAGRLLDRHGYHVKGGIELLMPNNYPLGRLPGKVEQLLGKALTKIRQLSEQIVAGEDISLPGNWLSAKFSTLFNAGMNLNRSRAWRSFNVDDSCTGCELCRRVCPSENIAMADSRPQWGRDCEQCLRCVNVCPEYSISFMRCKQKGRPQYLEPQLDIADLLMRD